MGLASSCFFSRGIFSGITPMSICDLMMSLGCCVNSQNMACVVFVPLGLTAILSPILDSCDRIATPTPGMFLQPLITHTKLYYVTL